jgi:hypothetical protein
MPFAFTYCFQPDCYAAGYYEIKEQLEIHGYKMYYSKNSWTNPEYKGINTRWEAPDSQRFEVQFHTSESFHPRHHVTHTAYERIRDSATGTIDNPRGLVRRREHDDGPSDEALRNDFSWKFTPVRRVGTQ